MNKQAVFDKVRDHLLAQNARSVDSVDACRYRGPNGLKCAIGCLISDKAYRPGLEGRSIVFNDPVLLRALKKSGLRAISAADMFLLSELQGIHDTYSPECWHAALARTAERHGLRP